MSLGRNKRGIEWSTLIEILLVIVATGFIIGVFSVAAARADEKTAENLCRGFNALRFGINEKVGFSLAPRACKTIDKKDVPSKNYIGHVKGIKEGGKAEIRDLMARCWWMWLEGNQRDMFNTEYYNFQNKCFICYTFSLDKDTGPITYEDFSVSLNDPYYAVDGTDRCAPGGQGGWCMDSCTEEFSREVPSNKCNPQESGFIETGEKIIKVTSRSDSTETSPDTTSTGTAKRKCCVSNSECLNKGGKCLDGPLGDYFVYYKNWKCAKGACYIKPEKSASYLDYIQGTKGVKGGAGKILLFDDGGFKPGQKYAITFISPGKDFDWNTIKDLYGTASIAAVTGVLLTIIPTGIGNVIGIGVLAFTSYQAINAGEINDINYVLISKYDLVKNHCAIEAGVGET